MTKALADLGQQARYNQLREQIMDLTRVFQAHRATGHHRGLPARLHRAGRRAVSIAVLNFTTLRRVAPAQTLPRGERGPRLATDLQPRPVPQSYPRRQPPSVPAGFVFVFSETEYWDQLPSLSSESKREDATARFLRRGFPYGFFSRDTLLCLHSKVSYPGLAPWPLRGQTAT